ALVLLTSRPALKRPLASALGAATVAWFASSLLLAWQADDDVRLDAAALPAFDGGMSSLANFKGQPPVVNLWATWCPPCRREMPMLQRAQAEHPEIHFVFINQGESAPAVQRFVAALQAPLRNVLLD